MENNCNLIFGTLVSGRYSIDGLYSGVAAKWGSTVPESRNEWAVNCISMEIMSIP